MDTQPRDAPLVSAPSSDIGSPLLETAPVIVVLVDLDGRIQHYNAFFELLSGWPLAEVRGRDWLGTFVPERDRERSRALFESAKRDGPTRGNVGTVVTRTGEERTIEWSDRIHRDAAGRAVGVVAIGVDVTARVRAEEELRITRDQLESTLQAIPARHQAEQEVRASEQRLRNILDSMFAFVGLCSVEGVLLDANRAPLEASGRTREDVIGKPLASAYWWSYAPEAEAQVSRALARAAAGETVREDLRARLSEDTFITLDATFGPLRDETGAVTELIASGVDVSDRRRTEREAAHARAMLQVVLDSTPDLIFAKDAAHRYLLANPSFSAGLGRTPEEIVGRVDTELVGPELCFGDPAQGIRGFHADDDEVLAGTTVRSHANVATAVDGATHVFDTIKVPLRDAAGQTYGVLGYSREVTDQRTMELALRASEERYRRLVEHAPVSVYVHDGQTILFANQAFARIMGASAPAEMVGRTLLSVIHPGDHETLRARIAALREGREVVNATQEGRFVRVDGGIVVGEVMAIACLFEGRPAIQVVLLDLTDRRRTQDDLRANQARLAEAQRIAMLGSWELDLQTNILTWSDEIYRIFEIDPAQFGASYEAFLNAIHPEDRAEVNNAYRRSVEAREPYEITHRLRMADGRVKHVVQRCETHYASDGTALRSAGTVQDVTERTHITESLRKSEDLFRAIFTGAAVGLMLTRGLQALQINDAYAELLGYSADEVVGMGLDAQTTMTYEEDRSMSRGVVQELIDGNRARFEVEKRYVRKDGEVVWALVRATTLPATRAEEPLTLVQAIDITSRKLARDALRASEERFRILFEQASVGMAQIDSATGRFLRVNAKYGEILGYAPEELLQLDFMRLSHPEDLPRDLANMDRLRAGELREFAMEKRLFRKDGTVAWVNLQVSPIWKADGGFDHHIAVVEDVTKRVQAEAERQALEIQLRQARKMEAIGTLAGGIAHDFNNLLAVVGANVEVALAQVGKSHPAAESLDDIAIAAARGADLVRQILAFSRTQAPKRIVVSVRPSVEETVKMLRAALPSDVDLAVRCDADVPDVLADPTQIHQVLMNLGTNAWHALEGRPGHITVHVDAVSLDATSMPTRPDLRHGLYARISVSDTGKGMDAATLERIFEPFFTTKDVGKGSGLGLAVVHGIVQAHEGTITAESVADRGATFRVYLPAASGSAEIATATPRVPREPGNHGRRILFLDDEPALVAVGVRLLEARGYRVFGFTRPADAMAAVRRDAASFDIVVTDFKMPGLSGLDVANEIGRLRSDLPVVVVSGHLDEETRRALASSCARAFLEKPYSGARLAEVLSGLLGD